MFRTISKVIAPHSCIFCNRESNIVCSDCLEDKISRRMPACVWCNRLEDTGKTCASCRYHTPLLRTTILCRLDDNTAQLIYKLKYDGATDIAELLGNKLGELAQGYQYDFVTCVPSEGRSQRRRGYNQAELIARAVSHSLGVPYVSTQHRTKHVPQIGEGRVHRLDQVKGNFVPAKVLTGKRILIVDDVVTTSATLSECARVLKDAGARSVSAAALAKK